MTLSIPSIAGKVHLGCSAQERKVAQAVSLEIGIAFHNAPPACESDLLKDTPCYAEMTDVVIAAFKKKHYATIENLALHCFLDLKDYLKKYKFLKKSKLRATITKKSPPIKAIKQGSQFSIEDLL